MRVIAVVLLGLALSANAEQGWKLVTVSGQTYANAKVQRVTTNSLVISYNDPKGKWLLEEIAMTNLTSDMKKTLVLTPAHSKGNSDLLGTNVFTANGITYKRVKVTNFSHSHITFNHEPEGGGLGIQTLDFDDMPIEWQVGFAYIKKDRDAIDAHLRRRAQERAYEAAQIDYLVGQARREWEAEERQERMVAAHELMADAASEAALAAQIQAAKPPTQIKVINNNTVINQQQNIDQSVNVSVRQNIQNNYIKRTQNNLILAP